MACELYCCLLPRCEALRSCRSRFPIATQPVPYQPNSGTLPKCLQVPPVVIYKKKSFDVMLHLGVEWPSKQNIQITDATVAEAGQ